jgi:haloalkane dehalogenase
MPDWLCEAFPFKRNMAFWNDERMHFVDEGEGPPVILIHGNPTWSFLWRNVIPKLVEKNLRVIAVDLVGFGFSSKPGKITDYSIDMQVDFVENLIEGLKLDDITMVGHDWGGPIGAATAARTRRNVRAAVFANTSLTMSKTFKTTSFHRLSHKPIISELAFRGFGYPVNQLNKAQGDPTSIGDLAQRAYRHPFPGWGFRAAPLAMARLVPNGPNHPSVPIIQEGEAWAKDFEGDVAMVWGTKDPVLGRALKHMKDLFPNAPVTETDGGHFLQEEVPDTVADTILSVAAGA